MADYWSGLIEGFQGRREGEYKKNYEREQQNRVMADRVFGQLLASKDPEMQRLALSGLMQPTGKKKGLAGFLGEVDSTDPILAQITARMNEMIPGAGQEPPAGAAPATPGGAAMSTNAPVRPGSAPIAMPGRPLMPEPPPGPPAAPQGRGMGPQEPLGAPQANAPAAGGAAGPAAAPTLPPGPPQAMESRWTRRGTGVPTAEEIAEMQARVPLETKIKVATAQLQQAGATPEEIQDAIMGMLGAPRNQKTLQQVSAWGVKIPGSDIVQPVLLDQTGGGGYMLANGQPLPPGSQMVRMGGGATGGLTSKIPDSPEGRQYLLSQGADPAEIAAGSPTGYWKLVTHPDGTLGVQADMFTPPPAFAGTGTILDSSNNPILAGVPRGGGPLVPLGAAPNPQPSSDQAAAQALLAQVQDQIKSAETPRLPRLPRTLLSPQQKDKIVHDAAVAAGLPYTTYYDLERATRVQPARQVTPRADAPPGTTPTTNTSTSEQVRQYILQQRASGGGAGTPSPVAPPVRPPVKPSAPARAGGPGPVGGR